MYSACSDWVLVPLIHAALGDRPGANLKDLAGKSVIPLVSILLFLLLWAQLAPMVETSLGGGARPGPGLGTGRG